MRKNWTGLPSDKQSEQANGNSAKTKKVNKHADSEISKHGNTYDKEHSARNSGEQSNHETKGKETKISKSIIIVSAKTKENENEQTKTPQTANDKESNNLKTNKESESDPTLQESRKLYNTSEERGSSVIQIIINRKTLI